MSAMKLEEAREIATKVIELSDKMELAYTHTSQKEIRTLAIMAGVIDAYNRGSFDNKF